MRLIHRTAFSACSSNTLNRNTRSTPLATRLHHASQPASCGPWPSPYASSHKPRRDSCSGRTNRLRAAATPAATSAPGQPIVVTLPASQQEAVEAAVQCLLPSLQPLLTTAKPAKTAKGFSGSSRSPSADNRFGLEIPVLDPSSQATLDLTALLLSTTAARLKQRSPAAAAAVGPGNWTVVHAREDAAALAAAGRGGGGGGGWIGGQVLGLRDACRKPQLGGLLLIVEPSVGDVALVEQLLDDVWCGPAAVVLNPGWAQQGAAVPEGFERLAESIAVAYSFLPCAIQGLLGRKEGAVLRAAEPGTPLARTPWRILLRQRDEFVQVGAMSRRPSSSDLELAFLNASAASSPLTKTAKFIRGLMPGGKDGKK